METWLGKDLENTLQENVGNVHAPCSDLAELLWHRGVIDEHRGGISSGVTWLRLKLSQGLCHALLLNWTRCFSGCEKCALAIEFRNFNSLSNSVLSNRSIPCLGQNASDAMHFDHGSCFCWGTQALQHTSGSSIKLQYFQGCCCPNLSLEDNNLCPHLT